MSLSFRLKLIFCVFLLWLFLLILSTKNQICEVLNLGVQLLQGFHALEAIGVKAGAVLRASLLVIHLLTARDFRFLAFGWLLVADVLRVYFLICF